MNFIHVKYIIKKSRKKFTVRNKENCLKCTHFIFPTEFIKKCFAFSIKIPQKRI